MRLPSLATMTAGAPAAMPASGASIPATIMSASPLTSMATILVPPLAMVTDRTSKPACWNNPSCCVTASGNCVPQLGETMPRRTMVGDAGVAAGDGALAAAGALLGTEAAGDAAAGAAGAEPAGRPVGAGAQAAPLTAITASRARVARPRQWLSILRPPRPLSAGLYHGSARW